MNSKPHIFIWAYVIWDEVKRQHMLSLWHSDDPYATHPPILLGAKEYALENEEEVYTIQSEKNLSETEQVNICSISLQYRKQQRQIHRQRPVVNRR